MALGILEEGADGAVAHQVGIGHPFAQVAEGRAVGRDHQHALLCHAQPRIPVAVDEEVRRIEFVEPAVPDLKVLLRQALLLAVIDVDGALLGQDVEAVVHGADGVQVRMSQFGQDHLEAVGLRIVFHHAQLRHGGIDGPVGCHGEVRKRVVPFGELVACLDLLVADAQHRVQSPDRHPLASARVLQHLRIILQLARERQLACRDAPVEPDNLAGRMPRRIHLARRAVEEVVRIFAERAAVLPRHIRRKAVRGVVVGLYARIRGNIECTRAILHQRGHEVVGQRMGVGRQVGVGHVARPVEANEAILGAKP